MRTELALRGGRLGAALGIWHGGRSRSSAAPGWVFFCRDLNRGDGPAHPEDEPENEEEKGTDRQRQGPVALDRNAVEEEGPRQDRAQADEAAEYSGAFVCGGGHGRRTLTPPTFLCQ